ncbi:MAG TPA: hypothetical protein VE781_14490 [Kineosporiaceae bacterium]|jgi:hypothetical protein|nr:hypothetical protein [Kineosporiaceae bacterium]
MAEPASLQTRRTLIRVAGIVSAFWLAMLFLWLGPRQHVWFVLVILAAFIASVIFTLQVARRSK